MRRFLLFFLVSFTLESAAQTTGKILISCIISNPDSVAIPDVAVIDVRTGKTVRTNSNGFFQIEIAENDSLLAYHIAYKKRFININDNGKSIVLEPEVQEIMQVDILDNKEQEQKKINQVENDIKRIAPLKKNEGYDPKVSMKNFVAEHGSHDKAYIQFFGPTVGVSTGQIATVISKISNKRKLKKLTSHYHLVKKKDQKEELPQ